jgi:hypothetical protein
VQEFGGSFQGFIEAFERRYDHDGTALQLAQMVTDTFPSFRDEHWFEGRRSQYDSTRLLFPSPPIPPHSRPSLLSTTHRTAPRHSLRATDRHRHRVRRDRPTVFFWKRAQIMIAETWAAFSPSSADDPHPLFPRGIGQLTMFADYRVPQVLHHLHLLAYAPELVRALEAHEAFASGAREEIAIRAASIVAVERVAAALRSRDVRAGAAGSSSSSVLIDFFLWDLAKRLEVGEDRIEGIKTQPMLPAHRTRSIWY